MLHCSDAFSSEVYRFYGITYCKEKPSNAFPISALVDIKPDWFLILKQFHPEVNWKFQWFSVMFVDSLIGTRHTLNDLYIRDTRANSQFIVQLKDTFWDNRFEDLISAAMVTSDGDFIDALYRIALVKSQRGASLIHRLLRNESADEFNKHNYWPAFQHNILQFDKLYHSLIYNKLFSSEMLRRYDNAIAYELAKEERFRGHQKDALDYVIQDYLCVRKEY